MTLHPYAIMSRLSFSNHSKGGETIFFIKRGARKGLDLKNNTTATSIKGDEKKSRGSERSPAPSK